MKEKEALVQEIKKSGFILERKASLVFSAHGFEVESNRLLPNSFNLGEEVNRLVEVDLIAMEPRLEQPGDAYIVECKGSSSDDRLVLMATDHSHEFIPSIQVARNSVTISGTECSIFSENNKKTGPFICHTGDFFEKKSDGSFKKYSKQDDKNNLYKGLIQLHCAIDGFVEEYTKNRGYIITPMIAVNAEIEVVNFRLPGISEENPITTNVPWTAFRNPLRYSKTDSKIGKYQWSASTDDSNLNKYRSQYRVPFVWIVNINYLKAFINSSAKKYS